MTPTNRQSAAPRKEFASRLTLVMNEAMRLGLYRTMHKLHDAVREVGWELADIAKKEQEPKDSRYETRTAKDNPNA